MTDFHYSDSDRTLPTSISNVERESLGQRLHECHFAFDCTLVAPFYSPRKYVVTPEPVLHLTACQRDRSGMNNASECSHYARL